MTKFRELRQIAFEELKHHEQFWAQAVKPATRMKDLFLCWKRTADTMGHRDKRTGEIYWYDALPDEIVFVPKKERLYGLYRSAGKIHGVEGE